MILAPVGTGRGSGTDGNARTYWFVLCWVTQMGTISAPSSHLVGVEENDENE